MTERGHLRCTLAGHVPGTFNASHYTKPQPVSVGLLGTKIGKGDLDGMTKFEGNVL